MSEDPASGREEAEDLEPKPVHAREAGFLVLANALSTLAVLAVPIVVVRMLGKAEVASLGALLVVYETISLILTSGFPETLVYYASGRDAGERRAVARRVSVTLVWLGCLAGGLLVIAGLFGDAVLLRLVGSESVSLAPLTVLALLPVAELPTRVIPNLLVLEQKARYVSLHGLLQSLGGSLSVLIPVAMGYGVWEVAWCFVVVGGLRGLTVPLVLRLLYRRADRVETPVSIVQLIRFALPLGVTSVVGLLNKQLDRALALSRFTASQFATYHAGAFQIPIITHVPYAVGTAYLPRYVELFKQKAPAEALRLWRHLIGKVSLLVVPVIAVFVVAAEEVVELLFTAEYLDAAPILRLYSILTLGRVTAFGGFVVAAGRPDLVLRASLLSFASNLALSIPLTLTLGYIGPALGTTLAFIPEVTYYTWAISGATGLSMRKILPMGRYVRVVLVTAVAAVPAVAMKLYWEVPLVGRLVLIVLVMLAGFSAVGSFTGLIERSDWRFVGGWLRRSWRRRT
jgi:O-antigen/teichoic acid export membrane protein